MTDKLLNELAEQKSAIAELRKDAESHVAEAKRYGDEILEKLSVLESAYAEVLRSYKTDNVDSESLSKERAELVESTAKLRLEILAQEKKAKEAAEEQRVVHDLANRKLDYRRELSRLTSLRERADTAKKRIAEIDAVLGKG